MKTAIVHDWLTGMRGGEKVLEVFCELFPDADLYTLLHVPGSVSPVIADRPIHTTFVQNLPRAAKWYRYYLPLFPTAIEMFDLRQYDLVLSTSHCVAKGVITAPHTCHISYVHTPMRYVWDLFNDYFGPHRMGWLKRLLISFFSTYLRTWDAASAGRVDHYISNSAYVAGRIRKYYRRDATVIHPPVSVDKFSVREGDGDYYLVVSAFAPYKRIDLAVEAFAKMGKKLKVVGSGQDAQRLREMSGPNIEYTDWLEGHQVIEAFEHCKAFIFPGEEDFGITPVEAQAAGRPVIAYARGGALETVCGAYVDAPERPDPCTGVFFREQTVESLCEAVEFFERENPISPREALRTHAETFARDLFKENIRAFIEEKMTAWQNGARHV